MPDIGPMELIIVLAIALIVLGPKRLPEAGKGIGKGIRQFKEGLSGKDDEPVAELKPAAREDPAKTL